MKVYLAGSWNARGRLREMRETLRRQHFDVTATWLDEAGEDALLPASTAWHHAQRDLDQIATCNLVIMDTLTPSSTGGYDFEAGYATGMGKPVVRIGPARSIFHHKFTGFKDWEEALQHFFPNVYRSDGRPIY